MNKEELFYKKLQEVFIGVKGEGQGGFTNLIKIKLKYYEKIEKFIKNDIEQTLKKYPISRNELFNNLYLFFSKHLTENRDIHFIPTYPYNNAFENINTTNENTTLLWKTQTLYYVKTDKIFKNMSIEFNNLKFYFDASEIENKKANEKRSLIYELKKIKEDGTIVFKAYYKEDNINTETDKILKEIKKKIKNIEKRDLKKAFSIFKKQPEVDFFIYKDAKAFLQEQFNLWSYQHFWKNNEKWTPDKINQLQILKNIAFKIIHLISQFEDELVKIWNKPKFVKNSNYVITLNRLENFGEKGIEIIRKLLTHKNIEKQIEEWKELKIIDNNFKIDKILENNSTGTHLSQKYKFLPIDTKYFKDLELEILSLFDDLDNALDGWLIKSENYQALNTLLPKFKEKIQTIYIDPPFNLESPDQFHYRTNYKDSTWATLLENRLKLAKNWLNEKGSIFVRCDHNGNWIVRYIMDKIFGDENFRNEIIISKTRAKQQVKNQFIQQTESLFFYSKTSKVLLNKAERPTAPKWYPLLHFPRADCKPRIILEKIFYPLKNRRWALSQERINEFESKGKIRINEKVSYTDCKGNKVNGMPELLYDTEIIGNEWLDIPGYSQTLHFSTENSEILLKRVIESASNENDLVMDFFLGSGTTIAVAHKLKRKWIGVEMGEHFYTVILPRMKKVLAYDKSGISKEKDVKEIYNKENTGGFFKYYELEQFEEALANTIYKNHDPSIIKDKAPYEQYIFLKDEEMLRVLEIDYKNRKVKVDLNKLYPNIDIAETLSNLTGKWIKKIEEDQLEFEDGSKVNIKDLDYKLIKPLIWWE
jgi:adenine specific DNA methylase Mod